MSDLIFPSLKSQKATKVISTYLNFTRNTICINLHLCKVCFRVKSFIKFINIQLYIQSGQTKISVTPTDKYKKFDYGINCCELQKYNGIAEETPREVISVKSDHTLVIYFCIGHSTLNWHTWIHSVFYLVFCFLFTNNIAVTKYRVKKRLS